MRGSASTISCTKGCLCPKTARSSTIVAAFTRQRRLKLVLMQAGNCKICLSAQNEVSLVLLHEENCTLRVWSLVMHLIKSISGEVSSAQRQGPRRTVKMLDVLEKVTPPFHDGNLAVDLDG